MGVVEDAIAAALKAVEGLPAEYRVIGFGEVLRHELRGRSTGEQGGMGTAARTAEREAEGAAGQGLALPDAAAVAASDDRCQQTVWAVIALSKKGTEADVGTIRDEIRTSLGIAPQSRQNTGRTLRELTPRYVRRQKSGTGRGYCYEPSGRALEFFGRGDTEEDG